MRDAADITIRVRGVEYADIEGATLTRGLEQVADEVVIQGSERWLINGSARGFPLKGGDPCEFVVDGDVVLTGIISGIPISYSAAEHQVGISCISKAGNLTTSSYTGRPRTWQDVGVDRIARDVVAPYGIEVEVDADIGEPFARFAASVGETSWSVVQRALQKRGLWMVSRPNGDVAIVQSGGERYLTAIVGPDAGRPTNVLFGSREDRFLERNSEVIVVGQAGGRANWFGDQASKGFARADDPGVDQHRPLVIHEPSESQASKLKQRALWEVRTRAGKSRPLSYKMLAWAESDAGVPLWEPNRLVRVVDPKLDVDGEFLISRVVTTFGQGTTADLSVVAPETFQLLAAKPSAKEQSRQPDGKWSPWA